MRWVKSNSSLDPALNKALIFAAITETVTGLALVIVPSLVGHLLFGEDLSGIAIPIGRLTGIALIALGIACWPGPPLIGMFAYNALAALYLAYLGFAGGLAGIILWPAVALHSVLSILLGRTFWESES
ncbi:hypothetical protein ACVIHI_003147 [Bradyrhizobium sp. USDA 4524]|uniref:hypothetical protein n=1 Tax=unclassified Bradyrhizobium TaxID=2631580 RepID=UPI0020A1951B|nr:MULTISPECIES: hypothetical protein [unclassified Bradyrhizobium]MCP1843934.1 hypothetical protein [Bradyrhizobium sp. USDA 4538]MCP1904500.1 hypothetical protein [Bradyrhizobium sp. USDA 4537]MCP1989844.1 hypothetical protein [Bradyrhizobium sp. USDA 4539]